MAITAPAREPVVRERCNSLMFLKSIPYKTFWHNSNEVGNFLQTMRKTLPSGQAQSWRRFFTKHYLATSTRKISVMRKAYPIAVLITYLYTEPADTNLECNTELNFQFDIRRRRCPGLRWNRLPGIQSVGPFKWKSYRPEDMSLCPVLLLQVLHSGPLHTQILAQISWMSWKSWKSLRVPTTVLWQIAATLCMAKNKTSQRKSNQTVATNIMTKLESTMSVQEYNAGGIESAV